MIALYSCMAVMLLAAMGFLFQRPFIRSIQVLIIFFPLMALTLYYAFGHSEAWISYKTEESLPKNLPNINSIILELQDHLAKDPTSAEGWYLLGRLYLSEQQFEEASQAFAKSNALKPNQVETLMNYAESLFMQQDDNNAKQIESLLKQALIIDPENDTVTNLLAIHYYQQKEYSKAIALWEQLSEKYPPDSADGQAILKAIAKAQQEQQ